MIIHCNCQQVSPNELHSCVNALVSEQMINRKCGKDLQYGQVIVSPRPRVEESRVEHNIFDLKAAF